MAEPLVLVRREPPVAVATLNRPDVLNALSAPLMDALSREIGALDADDAVRAIVLTGSSRAFAAGADIAEMAEAGAVEMMERDRFQGWQRLRATRKPLIAAVSGYALGGGCELAMLCDMIIASDSAQFGQPEVRIGVMPGAGGTQLLTRALGKWQAMELVLTGRMLSAREMYDRGLVTRVVPEGMHLEEALRLAREIAKQPPIAVRLAKEAVQKAFLGTLEEGLPLERKNFYLLFATEDQREGMRAFLEKRAPVWQGK
ncbi:MAG: enoyl-CoA hydratase-related protein [Thermaerobacter sp.]|nr:enoyl-CoA hydratase-related protein [Thermaerobacter sp.]